MASFSHQLPWQVKDYLVDVAKRKLPARVGDKYATVVVACLTCLDSTSDISYEGANGGEEQRGMTVAARFIEKVLLLLDEISI